MQAFPRAGQSAPSVLLIGFGEVGQAFAKHLAAIGAELAVQDPVWMPNAVELAGAFGIELLKDTPDRLDRFDLVIAVVPASESLVAAQRAARHQGSFLYIDLSSSARETMRSADTYFVQDRFVDGAIMGAVSLHGHRTPMILSGAAAETAARLLRDLGFDATALAGSQAGDASGLKLLRSVLTKGLEAVTVECFAAANAMGLAQELMSQVDDIGRSSFSDFLDMLIRTHVVHAERRQHEVEAAVAQLRALNADQSVTLAVFDRFRRTAERLRLDRPFQGCQPTTQEALAWLKDASA